MTVSEIIEREAISWCNTGLKLDSVERQAVTSFTRWLMKVFDDPALTAALSDQPDGWQDIATAPKGIDVLLGWWRTWPERQWQMVSGLAGSTRGGWLHGQATHWQPPPPSPSGEGK